MKKSLFLLPLLLVVFSMSHAKNKGPTYDNSQDYLSPFTSDDVVAVWVDSVLKVRSSQSVGKAIGAAAGKKIFESSFFGAILGKRIGAAASRKVAMTIIGGKEVMIATSDISFESAEDLAFYLYGNFTEHKDFIDIIKIVETVYPEFKKEKLKAFKVLRKRKDIDPLYFYVPFENNHYATLGLSTFSINHPLIIVDPNHDYTSTFGQNFGWNIGYINIRDENLYQLEATFSYPVEFTDDEGLPTYQADVDGSSYSVKGAFGMYTLGYFGARLYSGLGGSYSQVDYSMACYSDCIEGLDTLESHFKSLGVGVNFTVAYKKILLTLSVDDFFSTSKEKGPQTMLHFGYKL